MSNFLEEIYQELWKSSSRLKNELCQKLSWSEATFYRKKAENVQLSPGEEFIIKRVAEAEIVRIAIIITRAKDRRLFPVIREIVDSSDTGKSR